MKDKVKEIDPFNGDGICDGCWDTQLCRHPLCPYCSGLGSDYPDFRFIDEDVLQDLENDYWLELQETC